MEDVCNTGLVLGIGCGGFVAEEMIRKKQHPVQLHVLFPPKQEMERSCSKTAGEEDDQDYSSGNYCRNLSSHEDDVAPRKKLRLTKDQSSLLEEIFKQHHTLTPTQKQELAAELNLRPRQVEVWFQNRRARTKSKQTEVDCEVLKKCCENLGNENRRLKKELQELRLAKMGSQLCIQIPRGITNVTMCPSCGKHFKFPAT